LNTFRTRPDVMSLRGIVSSSSIQSSLVGAKILESGGNIADAAIATSAVLCITQNNLCGLGGDGFALLKFKGNLSSLNSSGKSSHNISSSIYERKQMKQIPHTGPLAAINVPGLVSLWIELYKKSTMEFRDLIKPAISLARNGFPVTHNYAKSLEVTLKHTTDKNFIETFSRNGSHPLTGDIFYQEDLATVLDEMAEEGPDTFYRGRLSERLVKAFEKSEVCIDSEDMSSHTSILSSPVASEFEDRVVYELPPNSQGSAVNFSLNTMKMMNESGADDLTYLRSALYGNTFRRTYIGDPERMPLPENFESEDFIRKVLDSDITNHNEQKPDGDTTYFTISTEDGDAISMIQSNYTGFGSTVVPEGTGISLQNRGSYFSLNPENHNFLEPGKRTFHTLCACMVERENEYEYSIGTMGGDIQPQIHLAMLLNLIRKGMSPQEAIDAPRLNFTGSIYEEPSMLIFENESMITEEMLTLFKDRKYTGRFSSAHGHCQIIKRNENGVIMGGADPRGDGFAIPVLQ
jgi:Gamma-glutamyltransferase